MKHLIVIDYSGKTDEVCGKMKKDYYIEPAFRELFEFLLLEGIELNKQFIVYYYPNSVSDVEDVKPSVYPKPLYAQKTKENTENIEASIYPKPLYSSATKEHTKNDEDIILDSINFLADSPIVGVDFETIVINGPGKENEDNKCLKKIIAESPNIELEELEETVLNLIGTAPKPKKLQILKDKKDGNV